MDPFVSAKYLSDSFRQLGVRTTALYTADLDKIEPYHAPRPEYFDEQIRFGSRDLPDILDALGTRRFDFVLNGTDGAAEITDRISQALTPGKGNDPATSAVRTNKRLMQEAVGKRGLAHIAQREITSWPIAADDPALAGLKWPCFIKPSRGGGSVGIAKLEDYNALTSYLKQVKPAELLDDLRISLADGYTLSFLLSEYVEGQECVVDSYSHQGAHYISSVQIYTKQDIDGSPIYRTSQTITDPEKSGKLTNYVRGVLDSIGLVNGFAHTEIFLKADGEPVLVEVNPRISGAAGWINKLAAAEGLTPQPALFESIAIGSDRDTNYSLPQHSSSRLLYLSHFSKRPVPDLTALLAGYRAVQSMQQLKPVGYVHPGPPRSTGDWVAMVLCSHADSHQLDRECEEILRRDLEGW